MRRETIYTLKSLYRVDYTIDSFTFGTGSRREHPEKSLAIMGSMRGDEVQQLYIASQLVRQLAHLETAGLIDPDAEIRVIPCGNPFSLNTRTRFWAVDNTDINRMFPGYDKGETTQRIAAGIFESLQGFGYGVQLTTFYLPGDFVGHVRVMDTGNVDVAIAKDFGLPYAVIRKPEPVDSGTLNYNWQIWDTQAVSLYSRKRASIDEQSAEETMFALIRFMTSLGIVRYDMHGGFKTSIVKEEHLVNVRANTSGLISQKTHVGTHVAEGQELSVIYDPITGEVLHSVTSPATGVVFFSGDSALVSEDAILYRIIDDRIVED